MTLATKPASPPADAATRPPVASVRPPVEGDQVLRRALAGARLLTARGIGMRIVSVASNLALIALVTPADFGLLAVVRGLTALAGNATDLGFAWALIRRPREPSREEYAGLAGVQLTIVLAILGTMVVRPRLLETVGSIPPAWHGWMLATLAATLVVPLGTGAKIRIERRMDYRRIAIYDVTSILLLNATLLGFAAIGRFTLGVFVATTAHVLYGNLLLWCWSPGPAPSLRVGRWRGLAGEFAGFSLGHLGFILNASATPLVVASLFGLTTAGVWSFAMRLGNILQVAFEGFRRAAIPAAAHLIDAPASLRRLVGESLLGAGRLTVPLIAAMVAGLPVVGVIWPRWAPAVPVAQLYVVGFGVSGFLAAGLTPAAVALRGAPVAIGEQATPMVVGWIGFFLLAALGSREIAWVVLPMYAALIAVLWLLTDRSVRPRSYPGLGRLGLGLLVAVAVTMGGEVLGAPPLPVAVVAGLLFAAVAWLGSGRGDWSGTRNLLVRLLGWRGLVLQSDPPTWDRYRWLRRHLRPGPGRVLDAGSGSGAFTLFAASLGRTAVGLSHDEAANGHAARRATLLGLTGRVRFRTVDLRRLPDVAGELGWFDQIYCLETIEHVRDDQRLLDDLAALLRPGGALLVTTPSADHPPLFGERLSPTEDGGHVRWGYTPAELTARCERAGLRVVATATLSGVVSQSLTNLARRLATRVGVRPAWALTAPLRVLLPLDRALTRLLRRPWLAVGVVGVKP